MELTMLIVRKEYLGKGVQVTFDTLDGRTLHVDLDSASQEQLKLLKENKHDQFIADKKEA
jgi:hypothetical protein